MEWKEESRQEYRKRQLDLRQLAREPMEQFSRWHQEAQIEEDVPSAFCLSTSSSQNQPSARMLLMKSFDDEGICFFTNYDSRKGREMRENPQAVALFYWPHLERQVIMEGSIETLDPSVSDDYFQSRPVESRVCASISKQGEVVVSREDLMQRFQMGLERSRQINLQRPPWWGGYRLRPLRMEFWQGREYRLHDRLEFLYQGDRWKISRLSP